MPSVQERVVQVGDEAEAERRLRDAGWVLEKWTAERVLDNFGARSAPVLVFVDPDGEIRYRGGYARRSDGRDGYRDQEIWSRLRNGESVPPLPAYGCAFTFGCAVGGIREAVDTVGK